MRGTPYLSALSGWWEWTGTEVRPRLTNERCASVLIQDGVEGPEVTSERTREWRLERSGCLVLTQV